MIRSIVKIDEGKSNEELEEAIKPYKNIPGVWILVGTEKKRAAASRKCLQVGKGRDIGGEIVRDILYLSPTPLEFTPKDYVNQFGEFIFSYEICPDRAMQLYKDIAQNYDNLEFVCVTDGEKSLPDGTLREIEKYVAYKTLCRYWVNGRQYKQKDEQKIEEIKKACRQDCDNLFKAIKNDIGQVKATLLREFLEEFDCRD